MKSVFVHTVCGLGGFFVFLQELQKTNQCRLV